MFLVFALLSCFLLVACSEESAGENDNEGQGVEDTPVEDADDEAEIEEIPTEEAEQKADYDAPLTGLPLDEEAAHTAFGVMIENSTSARPQTGLYQADLVYEVLSEATITRFLAIFHSQEAERIGPIRSARDYYVHLNKGYDAIYVSAGGSPSGLELAESDYVPYISAQTYDQQYFSRSSERSAPHNMYTTFSDLVSVAELIGLNLENAPPQLPFDSETSTSRTGEEVDEFEVLYGSSSNNVKYEYDEKLNGYRRSNGGVPTEDHDTETPVAPQNVFVVEASHRVIDDAGRRDIDITSGGEAYLFQDGVKHDVDWQSDDGVILPYHEGEPVQFVPGQTWINIVPKENGGLTSQVEMNIEGH